MAKTATVESAAMETTAAMTTAAMAERHRLCCHRCRHRRGAEKQRCRKRKGFASHKLTPLI
jgi:hypothetical protein